MYRHYAWFVRGQHHAALCRTSAEAVRKADGNAKLIVVTDDPDVLSAPEGAVLLRIEPGMPIMLANLEAQVVVRHYVHDEPVFFIDTDTLLVRPFEPIVGDIIFTWRDSIGLDEEGEKVEGIAQRMPYNYGVVIANPTAGAIEALIWMRERVRVMHAAHQQWYGNQLAAAELAGPRPASGSTFDRRRIPWRLTSFGREITVGKIPCERYNYTPQALGEDLSERHVLHFKGGKRALMQAYAAQMGLGWYVDERAASRPAAAV